MISDPIADTITRIRNAYIRKHQSVEVPYSIMNLSILETLKSNGFVQEVKTFKFENSKFKGINVLLKYEDGEPAIGFIGRVSRSGLRRYVKSKDIERVLGGLGMYIVSTPRGVMSGSEARRKKLGGELLCKVY